MEIWICRSRYEPLQLKIILQLFKQGNENKGSEKIIQKITTDAPKEDDEREGDISPFQQISRQNPIDKRIAVQHAHRYPKYSLINIPGQTATSALPNQGNHHGVCYPKDNVPQYSVFLGK